MIDCCVLKSGKIRVLSTFQGCRLLLSYQKKHLSQTKRLHFRRARKALGWRRAGQKKPSHLAYKTIRFHADDGTHRFGTELAPEPPRDWHIKQLRSLATMPTPFPVKSMSILARLMANGRSPCRAQWHIRKDHAPLCVMCNGGRGRCLAAGSPGSRRTDNTRDYHPFDAPLVRIAHTPPGTR